MEEFKSAHSKMFNKLRQKQTTDNNNERQHEARPLQQPSDVYGDVTPASTSACDDVKRLNGNQQHQAELLQTQPSGHTPGNAASGNLVIRPRTTVATN